MRNPDFRWDPYFLAKGSEFEAFWEEHFRREHRNILYVLGRGFDPRMCIGLGIIMRLGGEGKRDCLIVKFDEGPDSPSTRYKTMVDRNLQRVESLVDGRGERYEKLVPMWSGVGPGRHRIGSRSAAQVFSTISDLRSYDDVIIDVSAIPRDIYLPLIGKAIYLIDKATSRGINSLPNLHVVVCENVSLDQKINDSGIDDRADYVHGFGASIELEAMVGVPKVWVPILGERQDVQLERIYTLVSPDEICPVLPSPSVNPRRGDELLIHYLELLDRWRVEPRNMIYASEQNPFEAYRQIGTAAYHYNVALRSLGGCKIVLSALSSKLLSIAALLVAYELKSKDLNIGIAHVEPQGYELGFTELEDPDKLMAGHEMFSLWLSGEPYD